MKRLLASDENLPSIDGVSDNTVRSLLKGMLVRDSSTRITAREALNKAIFFSAETSSELLIRSEIADFHLPLRPRIELKSLNELSEAFLVIGMQFHRPQSNPVAVQNQTHPEQPLFLMEYGALHCLTIRLTFLPIARLLIRNIKRVTLTFSEERDDGVCLDFQTEVSDMMIKATVLFDKSHNIWRKLEEHSGENLWTKIHRVNVTIVLGTSDSDSRKRFDVVRNCLIQCVPPDFVPGLLFERAPTNALGRSPHNSQNWKTCDLFCGKITMDFETDSNQRLLAQDTIQESLS